MNIVATLNSSGNDGGFRTEPGEHLVAAPLTNSPYADNEAQESKLVIAHTLRGEGFDASEDGTGRGTPLVAAYQCHGTNVGPMGTLRRGNGNEGGGVPFVFQTRIGRNGRGAPSEVAHALTSAEGGTHADSKPHVCDGMAVRRLTPRECERLQAFPDDWTRWDDDGNELSDSARYRCIGNAVCVNVARWIGRRLTTDDGPARRR